MTVNIKRRDFIRLSTAAAVASTLPLTGRLQAQKQADSGVRVVRVHSSKATRPWDYSRNAPWNHTVEPGDGRQGKIEERYYDYINEPEVFRMLERGLCELTGCGSSAEAWRSLLPGVCPGQKVTLKLNLNNASFDPAVTTNRMDQTIPLVNAVLAGLVDGIGLRPETITLLDASRWFHPQAMKARCSHSEVNWVDSGVKDRWDSAETVKFTRDQPQPGGDFRMPKAYTDADHILNLCLMKNHDCGITGAMKNHFGSIPTPQNLHDGLGDRTYIADLCNTPSIKNKVRLNIADALFANWHNNVWAPRPWKTFPEESPNSLLLSCDPVALDSVMLDHIAEEVRAQGDDAWQGTRDCLEHHTFLQHAMELHKLGVHEHKPYRRIQYLEYEI